jgi:hypothetical protein
MATFYYRPEYWFMLIGEVPLMLSVILGAVLISNTSSKKCLILGGFVFGVSLLIKQIALFAVISATLYLLTESVFGNIKAKSAIILIFIVTTMLPTICWNAYKKHSLADVNIAKELKQSEQKLFMYNGSGIGQIIDSDCKVLHIKNTLVNNVAELESTKEFRGSWRISIILIIITVALLSVQSRGNSKSHYEYDISIVLILAGIIHFYWWLFLSSQGNVRHLVPALLYLLTSFASMTMLLANYRKHLMILSMLFIMLPAVANMRQLFGLYKKSDKLIAQLETVEFIKYLKSINDNTVMFGAKWWANRDLEYLLPTVGNFRDIAKCVIISGSSGTQYLLIRNDEFWNRENSQDLSELANGSGLLIIYQNKPFRIEKLPI